MTQKPCAGLLLVALLSIFYPSSTAAQTVRKPTISSSGTSVKSAGKVTGVTATVTPVSYTATGTCDKTFTFKGAIKTDGAAKVTYTWIRSDQAKGPNLTLTFTAAGTKPVSNDTWDIAQSYKGWEAIEIISPVKMTSIHAAFTLNCSTGVKKVK